MGQGNIAHRLVAKPLLVPRRAGHRAIRAWPDVGIRFAWCRRLPSGCAGMLCAKSTWPAWGLGNGAWTGMQAHL